MKRRELLSTMAAALPLSALAQSSGTWKQKVDLPKPYHTESANNRPQVVDRPARAKLEAPAGFRVEEYSSGEYKRPRMMLLGPSGELLLSDSERDGAGSVFLLTLDKSTYKPAGRRKLIANLDRPFGLALYDGYLYVAETTSLKRHKYDAAKMAVGPGQEVVSMKNFGQGHWTRAVIFDEKAKKMYLTIGSASNVDAGEDPMRAAIHRYNPDGSGHEVIATGTRNATSIRLYPGTSKLYAAVQERDALGDDLVPDYLTEIKPGGFYGWPYAYIGPNEDPRRKGEAPDLVKKTLVPDVVLGAHVAVIDFIFHSGKNVPAKYKGGAFLAYHGSWNRSERVGYSVAFIPFKDARPAGPPEDFVTGWMLAPEKREVWGRPVGLLELPDGSMLLTDDGANKVWRISHTG
jgi:glucose/arabinose dehydrogenase